MLPLVLGICMLNGLASPVLPMFWASTPLWLAGYVPETMSGVTYLSSLAVSTLTLMVSGIPAALYERYTGAQESTATSLFIWMAGAALLTLPAIPGLIVLAKM